MRVLTSEQMREADRRTIHDIGIPGIVLMENAGRQVASAMEAHIEGLHGGTVAVLASHSGTDSMNESSLPARSHARLRAETGRRKSATATPGGTSLSRSFHELENRVSVSGGWSTAEE